MSAAMLRGIERRALFVMALGLWGAPRSAAAEPSEPATLPGVMDEVPAEAEEAEVEAPTEGGSSAADATPVADAEGEAPSASPKEEAADDAAIEPPPPPEPEGAAPMDAAPASDAAPAAPAGAPVDPAPRARAAGAEGPEVDRGRRGGGDLSHRGAIFEVKTGVLGCLGALCAGSSGHGAGAGLGLGGFLGGNIGGFVDLGVEGGWGRLAAQGVAGRNLAELYGIDVAGLVGASADDPTVQAVVSALTVQEAKMDLYHGGPAVRVHVIPRGRISAYVGSGAHYQDFRVRYRTAQEPISVAFHGMSVPAVVGLGLYPHKNIALGVEARYIHSMYWIAALSSSAMSGPVPLSILDSAAMDAGASPVRQRLPSFWTVNASARLRF